MSGARWVRFSVWSGNQGSRVRISPMIRGSGTVFADGGSQGSPGLVAGREGRSPVLTDGAERIKGSRGSGHSDRGGGRSEGLFGGLGDGVSWGGRSNLHRPSAAAFAVECVLSGTGGICSGTEADLPSVERSGGNIGCVRGQCAGGTVSGHGLQLAHGLAWSQWHSV